MLPFLPPPAPPVTVASAEAPLVVAWTPGTPPGTWDAARLPVAFVLAGPDPVDIGARAELELELALRAWPETACTAFRASYGGRVAVATAADDGVNEVIWESVAWPADLQPGVLAQTVLHLDAGGRLHDADIHVNAVDFRWSLDGRPGTADARGVLTHELGHALGLGHASDPAATMFASRADTIAWRSLEKDDVDGVCALYPGAGAARCDQAGGAACPTLATCVGRRCLAPFDREETCSPCLRESGACAGAGEGARCVDLSGGRVCAPACAIDADCGARFHCAPTSSAGDRQCVADDACATGPFPCANDTDCARALDGGLSAACRSGACVALVPGADADAGADAGEDAGSDGGAPTGPVTAGGGCACGAAGTVDARLDPRYHAIAMVLLPLLAVALRRRRRATALGLAAVVAGCAGASGPSPDPSPPPSPGTASAHGACGAVVRKIACTGARHGANGLVTWVFDMTLANPGDAPRWLVFPEMFPREGTDTPFPGKGTILNFDADLLAGRGRVVALHATGEGGFRAVELPAHGEVVLNEVPVNAVWNEKHDTARVDVLVARGITIDDDPVASVVRGELASDGDGPDVSLSADPRDRLPLTRFFGVPAVGKPTLHPVAIDEECRATGQAVLKDEEP